MGSFRPDPNILKKHPNAITQQQIEEKSRFVGTLLGAAAGEALGAPHEFKSASELRPVPREITGGGIWAAGEPTDDIELTLALLRSIVARHRLDVDDVAQGYLKWFSGNPKDVGALTRAALENLRAGEPPTQSGAIAWEDTGRKSAGNGSVMCCAPIGLLHVKSLDGLAEDATAASRITHYDPRCVGSCVAVATAIAHLVRGETDEAVERAASAGGAVSDDVRAAVERGAARSPGDLHFDGEDRGYVLHTVELAFSALASAKDFEDGLLAVVARGGDTDTNACVAGALLGAKFGKSRIPDRWLSKLKAAPDLTSLAEQLYRLL
ncbi:MAG TPA: ADP-ribosylglycohydrolase family protein [Myxococcales bacterium]|jgi:ADP-ribosyl-[dinitrogen reductase] hydrolase|nr:ADP-ribosylglycohydrolase family protein [Myxococcales bacterium]